MSIRILDFADGFTSASSPSSTGIETTAFAKYADNAEYELSNGVAQDGDAYYNTTLNKVIIYENGAWVENASFEA